MKFAILSAAAFAASAGLAMAGEMAPADVKFDDYGAVAQSLTGVPGDPAEGRKVLAAKSLGNCVACHQISEMSDVPFQGEVGPSLDGTGSRWDEAGLRGIVVNAKMTFDGSVMPAFYKNSGYIRPGDAYTGKAAPADLSTLLTAQQVEDVVAYLMTLKDE